MNAQTAKEAESKKMLLPDDKQFHIHHGDCIEHMASMPSDCVDFSIWSPPFAQLYSYTSLPNDIGNSENFRGDGKIHMSFFYRQFARVLKPGRVVIVHVAQVPRMKRAGEVGLFDFRGFNIRLGERAGLVFEYDWVVRKNPQAQAIRTKSRELQFSGLENDRAKSRGTLPDYLLKFRAPGENAVKVDSDDQVSRDDWIRWAECCWSDVRETYTLNVKEGRGENDTKHICPLQLDVIGRCIRLFSNPGEIVFSPFSGIGSELYMALKLGRRAYGCEIKDEYCAAAMRNCERALAAVKETEGTLFAAFEASTAP